MKSDDIYNLFNKKKISIYCKYRHFYKREYLSFSEEEVKEQIEIFNSKFKNCLVIIKALNLEITEEEMLVKYYLETNDIKQALDMFCQEIVSKSDGRLLKEINKKVIEKEKKNARRKAKENLNGDSEQGRSEDSEENIERYNKDN